MTASGFTGARRSTVARNQAKYLVGTAALAVLYVVATGLLWTHRDWTDSGPLNFHEHSTTTSLDGRSLDTVRGQCAKTENFHRSDSIKVVGARIDGEVYYACYDVRPDGAVYTATVIDGDGLRAPDRIIKQAGAWRWIGTIKTPSEIVLNGAGLLVVLGLYFIYYRRVRPGPPVPARWWQTRPANAVLGTVLTILFPVFLAFPVAGSRARRLRLLFLWLFGVSAFFLIAFLLDSSGDRTSVVVLGFDLVALLFGWLGGRWLLRPPGFGAPEGAARMTPAYAYPPSFQGAPQPYPPPYQGAPQPYPPPYQGAPQPYPSPQAYPTSMTERTSAPPRPPTGSAEQTPATTAVAADPALPGLRVQRPGTLATFAQVGGMTKLKDELADTFGLLLAFADEADTYRISFNGVLLHGPPGVGKTFLAQATAGEFGLNFVQVSTGDLISKYVGESARNIKAVFAQAARNVPCVLFFDEFDSIAERRDDGIGEESKRVVNQLLQSLEKWRGVRELVIVAATNLLDRLDPAVVRPGRFDRHIRVDLPDLPARRAIIQAHLSGRPVAAGIDVDDLAERTAGRTPATIRRVVEAAALSAFRAATESGAPVPITALGLRTALDGLGGTDRPTVEDWSWDRLILADQVTAELRQVQALVADPDLAARYGVKPPSGLLLAGPPGTGKTTVARVFAAQAGCSFYAVTAADLTSKWVGESEATVVRLFTRARENAPSIIFIDEIDAIAGTRTESGSGVLDRTLTQLLSEIDGMTEQRGVFVMAATNRPDALDPALLRGGRLSRTIVIPLPDEPDRLRMLQLFSRTMPLRGVDLGAVAAQTSGYSGADLAALCQQAALQAMLTAHAGDQAHAPTEVGPHAFATAMAQRVSSDQRQNQSGPAAPANPSPEPAPEPPLPPGAGGYL